MVMRNRNKETGLQSISISKAWEAISMQLLVGKSQGGKVFTLAGVTSLKQEPLLLRGLLLLMWFASAVECQGQHNGKSTKREEYELVFALDGCAAGILAMVSYRVIVIIPCSNATPHPNACFTPISVPFPNRQMKIMST